MWFVIRQSWHNPLICWVRGAFGASQRYVNWNLDSTSETRWGPLSPRVFPRLASTLSHCLSHFLFSNQVRLYQGPSVSNRYRLWNFRRRSVWEPQYRLCSSRPEPLQTRGRFLKRREKLHKGHIGGRFKQTDSWNTFISCSTSSLGFLPLLYLFSLCITSVTLHWLIARSIYNIEKKTSEERPPFAQICRFGEEIPDAIVCCFRNPYQSDHSYTWIQTPEGLKWSWMMACPCGPTLCALWHHSVEVYSFTSWTDALHSILPSELILWTYNWAGLLNFRVLINTVRH